MSRCAGTAQMVEAMPVERAPGGYERMRNRKARFRIVLTMNRNKGGGLLRTTQDSRWLGVGEPDLCNFEPTDQLAAAACS